MIKSYKYHVDVYLEDDNTGELFESEVVGVVTPEYDGLLVDVDEYPSELMTMKQAEDHLIDAYVREMGED